MCILAAKYFPSFGWCVAKNRDRSYKPSIKISQSFRNGIERCLLWDEKTKWTEGLNEFGVGIINTTLLVIRDEAEGYKRAKRALSDRVFYNQSGKIIRTALYEQTVKSALDKLIELKIEGFNCVFSKDEAYIIEALPMTVDDKYEYKYIKLDKNKVYVRTNHGIIYPQAGYPEKSDDPKMVASRKSSESRYDTVHELLQKVDANNPKHLLRILSAEPYEDKQLNPLRRSQTHGKHIMCTTGQLLIIPALMTMHYRPIWCETEFDFNKIDNVKSKTFFELVSSNFLLSTENSKKFRSFKEYYKEIRKT